jgi:hypothetical protein
LADTADADIALAESEAAEAGHLLATLESQSLALDPADRPRASQVTEARELATFAKRRIAVATHRAEKARAARRLAGLADLGQDVDECAEAMAGPGSDKLTALLSALASAAEDLRAQVGQHDARVTELARRAAGLNCEPAVQGKPVASSAFVARAQQNQMVQHRGTQVSSIGGVRLAQLVDLSVRGDLAGTEALVSGTVRHRAHRADHYFLIHQDGSVLPCNGVTNRPPYTDLVRGGLAREMTDDEVNAHLRKTS